MASPAVMSVVPPASILGKGWMGDCAHAQEAGVDGNSYQHWQASFGGESFVTPTVYLQQHQFRGWYSATNTFTATSTSQVLSFLAFGTNGVPPICCWMV
ncbi:MAG: hypothetical protein FJ083_16530 [Cyanobacteria bacterium K_Offshore_surface_m2_239]|nr:hypothetical protein [Cyanobacteria bacterium K_Offshore_surface_m2_239]